MRWTAVCQRTDDRIHMEAGVSTRRPETPELDDRWWSWRRSVRCRFGVAKREPLWAPAWLNCLSELEAGAGGHHRCSA